MKQDYSNLQNYFKNNPQYPQYNSPQQPSGPKNYKYVKIIIRLVIFFAAVGFLLYNNFFNNKKDISVSDEFTLSNDETENEKRIKESADRLIQKIQDKGAEKKEIKNDDKEKIYQQSEVDKSPVAINLSAVRKSIKYPPDALKNGMEGKVTVKILVDEAGDYVKSGEYTGSEVFKDEIISKIKVMKFTPALLNGKPVKCWVSVPFNFVAEK